MLRAVANPAAGGQPGSFTTLTVSGNATVGGTLGVTGTSVFSDTVFFQKELALLNTMAEPGTIANRTQIYVDVADGLLKAKNGAGTVQVFQFV